MTRELNHFLLVRNRTVAFVVLILTGYVAVLTFRDAFFSVSRPAEWLVPLFFAAPKWIVLTINLLFYAFVVWICYAFFRAARDKERVVLGGWFVGIFLYPVDKFLPSFGAAVRYINAAAMGMALLAALAIFLGFCSTSHSQVQNDTNAS